MPYVYKEGRRVWVESWQIDTWLGNGWDLIPQVLNTHKVPEALESVDIPYRIDADTVGAIQQVGLDVGDATSAPPAKQKAASSFAEDLADFATRNADWLHKLGQDPELAKDVFGWDFTPRDQVTLPKVEFAQDDFDAAMSDPAVARVFTALGLGTIGPNEAVDRMGVMGFTPEEAERLVRIGATAGQDPDEMRGASTSASADIVLITQALGRFIDAAPPADGDPCSQFQVGTAEHTMCIIRTVFGDEGGGGPVYQGPDPNLVRDNARATLVAMVGRDNDVRVEELTNIYLNSDRQRFDGKSVDPAQAVKDRIRTYSDYKRIHELRPDSVDDMQWIGQQLQGLTSVGVSQSVIDERAILQAQIGVAPARAGEAGQLAEFRRTGRPLPAFFSSIQNAAQQGFSRVVR